MLMSTDEFTDENEPWIDALAEQDEEDWTNYLLETCSEEFSTLGEKGCNQKKLLELLWDVRIWKETYSPFLSITSTTLEGVRRLQKELTEAAEKIARLNIAIFQPILSADEHLEHLLDLPKVLRQYVKESRLLTDGDSNLTPLLDQRAEQLKNLAVCKLIGYVHGETGKWCDKELGKLVAAACDKSVDKTYTAHKKFRQRYYEKLKPSF
jgi:hypothetical protein